MSINNEEVNEPQDIDPSQWLAASITPVTDFVVTKAGRLKVAALTEKESEAARKRAETINPANPRGAKMINLTRMRKETVAASVNKAYGYTPGDPKFLVADSLGDALTGELTTIINKITEISGYVEDDSGRSPGELFQVS